jgi:hypothetical protein
MRSGLMAVLCAGTILFMGAPAMAQQGSPAFRVPIGQGASNSSSPPIYAWLESISECSATCGSGTRTTSYQCQNAADFDYSGGGYGAPESDALCTSSVGPKPSSTNASCTNYSGCGYDWVKPPIQQVPESYQSNPVGRVGCGYVRTSFAPYCQRTGGSTAVVLPSSDHRFCRNDTPDYNQVAAGDPDALGYDRKVIQDNACNTSDHDWRPNDSTSGWGGWSDTCSSTANATRVVGCYRRFDNKLVADAECSSSTKPATSKTEAIYTSCSYDYVGGTAADWSAWSSTCSNSATRTRNPQCRRSNGEIVADSFCTAAGKTKPTSSETQGVYSSCTYAAGGTTTNGAWSSQCSANAQRTVTRQCIRSNGDVVPDAECSSRSIALTSTQTQAVYDQCSYSFVSGAWGAWDNACSNAATHTRTVNCRRSDGTNVSDAECNNRGIGTPTRSETQAVYDSCGYVAGGSTSYGAWSSQCSANAQRSVTRQCIRSNGDVVASTECTNRGIAVTSTQTAAVYDQCGYSFSTGGWSDWNSHCSASATRTRSVQCYRGDGSAMSDAECNNRGIGTPARAETAAVYDQCGYVAGGSTSYGAWSSQCSANAQRTVTRQCVRADGTIVANAECTNRGVAVTSTQTAAVYDQCGYSFSAGGWSDWNSHCSASATRTRSVQCFRGDGSAMSDAECTNRGVARPASSETTAVYDQCGYTPRDRGRSACTMQGQQEQYWDCTRADGATGFPAAMCGKSNPEIVACTPPYTYAPHDHGVGACEPGNRRPHYWDCMRNDGQDGFPASYCGKSNPEYEACTYTTYAWATGGWSGWNSGCSANATRTRAVWCQGSDGSTGADSQCGGGRPASSETTAQYYSCSYNASYGGWSSCPMGANQQQTRSMSSCTRSDGAQVDGSYCANAGQPITQAQACSYNPGGFASGYVLGSYALARCNEGSINNYPNAGTMPGIDPAQCRTGVATYYAKCTNGGNFGNNPNCIPQAFVNNPRGPSGYPCDITCR